MKTGSVGEQQRIYEGVSGADGFAIGRVRVYRQAKIAIDRAPITSAMVVQEVAKLLNGIGLTKAQIQDVKSTALARIGQEEAGIFDAHLLRLDDPAFAGEIKERIETQHCAASLAITTVVEEYAGVFAALEDEYMRERSADIRDIGTRLLRNVLGIAPPGVGQLTDGVIIIASDLTPSDMIGLDKRLVKGIAIGKGSRTSHSAILARTLEIPAVLGLGDVVEQINDGDLVVIDGSAGTVIVWPDEQQLAHYRQETTVFLANRASLGELKDLPAATRDGRSVAITANIGTLLDIEAVISNGGDGVGLYRTEVLYMDRETLPSEDEQFIAYKRVAEALSGKPLIIRTLDIGGDKDVRCITLPREANPFLGWRAIRVCLSRRDIFKAQLRAILRASWYGNVLIMYPMISGVGEVRDANAVLAETKEELRQEKIAFNEEIKVGVMIEVPSAALTADIIVKEVDFVSIGTNDLCQYTLAVDRMNEKVSHMYQPMHPAVLRLINQVIDSAHKYGKPAGMCGELAGDPLAAVILLGLGLDEFSMSAASMPRIKQIIRGVSYQDARMWAKATLEMETAEVIADYAKRLLDVTREN